MPVLGTVTCLLLEDSKGQFSSCFKNEEGTGAPGTEDLARIILNKVLA